MEAKDGVLGWVVEVGWVWECYALSTASYKGGERGIGSVLRLRWHGFAIPCRRHPACVRAGKRRRRRA